MEYQPILGDASSYEVDLNDFRENKTTINLNTEIGLCCFKLFHHLNISDPTSTMVISSSFCGCHIGKARSFFETSQIQAITLENKLWIGLSSFTLLIVGIMIMVISGSLGLTPFIAVGVLVFLIGLIIITLQIILYLRNPYLSLTVFASGYKSQMIILRTSERVLIQKIKLWHRLKSEGLMKIALRN
jgi:hypothetical protein